MTSSVAGLTHLQGPSGQRRIVRRQCDEDESRGQAPSEDDDTNWMVSPESTDGTNSLFMNSPVGTAIFRPVAGMVRVTGWAMVCRRWVRMVVEERRGSAGRTGVEQLLGVAEYKERHRDGR